MFKKVIFAIGISSFLLSGIFAATIHSHYLEEVKFSPTMTPTVSPSPMDSPTPDEPMDSPTPTDDPTEPSDPTPTPTRNPSDPTPTPTVAR